MIARPTLNLHITTPKQLMRDRSLDPDEKVVMVALLAVLTDEDGIISITEDELATQLELPKRTLRLALGSLWAAGYLTRLDRSETDGPLHITIWMEGGLADGPL